MQEAGLGTIETAQASRRPRLSESRLQESVADFRRDGFVLLKGHFDRSALIKWQAAFEPLFEQHVASAEAAQNRGSARYYLTLPFRAPFTDPQMYEDPDVLHICRLLVGADMWMCQLASDTPLLGSTYQDVHRDALPLFPELDHETPPYQLAVNFPLVDVSVANGPTEIVRGTHEQPKSVGIERLRRADIALEPIEMRIGDVLIRDVRGLHRGTPNTMPTPRPMVVIGYSRRWLFRPEVGIRISQSEWEKLSAAQRYLLRFNPVVSAAEAADETETYRTFAF